MPDDEPIDLLHPKDDPDSGTDEDQKEDPQQGSGAPFLAFVVVGIVFLLCPSRPWLPYAMTLAGYTALAFGFAFGTSNAWDNLVGEPQRALLVLLLHGLILLIVAGGLYLWLHMGPYLPGWMTFETRKGSLWYWCGFGSFAAAGFFQGKWMASKFKDDEPNEA